jgi:hypothetical protein
MLFWPGLKRHTTALVQTSVTCKRIQNRPPKHGHLLYKVAEVVPFQTVCIDLFGPYRTITKDQKLHYVKLTDQESKLDSRKTRMFSTAC